LSAFTNNIWRATSFRIAMLASLLFLAVVTALFTLVSRTATRTVEQQLITASETEARQIARLMVEGDYDDINELVSAGPRSSGRVYQIIRPTGVPVMRSITLSRRLEGAVALGSRAFATPGQASGLERDEGVIGFGIAVPRQGYVFVGRGDRQLHELREVLIRTLLSAVAVTALIVLGGGTIVARFVIVRIDRFRAAAQRVIEGDLTSRMPTSGGSDEFNRLAQPLNAMLDQLEQSMESLRQISADIAHELRTPLARLKQRLEGLERLTDSQEQANLIDAVRRDADYMLDVFASLLRIAQIEAGAARQHFAEIDLSSLLRDLCQVYEPVAADGGRHLAWSVATNVRLVGDRALLQQLFTNLIENALRHTPDGACVSVSLATGADGWAAAVSDNGHGIPATERERVFDRFYRLEKSRTTAGNGLGLSLVRAIAVAHDLDVRAEDAVPGLRVVIGQRTRR